jgi:hypothetical protein
MTRKMLKEPDLNLSELSYNPTLLCRVKLLKNKKKNLLNQVNLKTSRSRV